MLDVSVHRRQPTTPEQCDAPKSRLVRVLKWMIANRDLVITGVIPLNKP